MPETYQQVEKERDELKNRIAEMEWEKEQEELQKPKGRELRKVNRPAITKLPWICAHRNAVDGKTMIIIRGEDGYIPADDLVINPDKFNMVLGVDAFQAEGMLAGSMFGWGVPGCDPDSYRQEGLVPITGSYTQLEKRDDPILPPPVVPPQYPTYDPMAAQNIADIVVTAFEGGSNHFIDGAIAITSTSDLTEKPWYSDPKFYDGDFKIEITTNDDDSEKHYFDREKYEKALRLMKTKHTRVWKDLINGDMDAETADVLIQYALFGEIVYG